MNHSDIEHMAQGLPPSSIGKDHEEVVIFLAKSLLTAQQKLDAVKALAGVAGEMNAVVSDGFAEVVAGRDALAAENAYLLPKAASELSNAWVLHKYWVGIQAALMHLRVGRMHEVEHWLQNTVAGPGIEAPNLKLTDEIDAWATEQRKDSISHSRALEIIKAETPATEAILNVVRAHAITAALSDCTDHCDTDFVMDAYDFSYEIAESRSAGATDLRNELASYAAHLRASAGKDGE